MRTPSMSRTALLLTLLGCNKTEPTPTATPDPADTGSDAPHTMLIAPYLQSVDEHSAWVLWVTETGGESRVDYGTTEALGQTARGTLGADGKGLLHEVQLSGLSADTHYWYSVRTGGTRTPPVMFKTAPAPGEGGAFRIVAASDMQRDDAHPSKWAEVVQDGVIPYLQDDHAAELPDAAGLVLIAGDLVDNGWLVDDWTDDFFAGAAPLIAGVPVYPVLGNHEAGSPLYRRYFHLPENGSPGYEEQWWRTHHGNVRLIGLDSNAGALFDLQLEWLGQELDQACTDDTVEFLFVELHHPFLSEPWTPGETDYTGDVVLLLEEFSTRCGKPSAHLFGHTHAYSRGQSRDHDHLWINVASGGGALDRWGSADQADYDQFSVSQSEYGFVVIEVEPGAFSVKRLSMGTPEAPTAAQVSDEVRVVVGATGPDAPTAVSPVGGAELDTVLQASAFQHTGGGAHGASHWQVSADCAGFGAPVVDAWLQHENQFAGEDTQAGDDLTDHAPDALEAGDWCWRVRYRDQGLVWSDWSEAAEFRVGGPL